MLRRVVQAYLATGQTTEQLVSDAELGWRDEQRVRFLVENLVEALAPSNVPVLNPVSAKAAMDTAGVNFVRGARNLVRDLAAPPRVPQMVDPSPFEVGRTIAVTPGAVLLRTEMLELIQYRPQTEQVREVPLLILHPQERSPIPSGRPHQSGLSTPLMDGDKDFWTPAWVAEEPRRPGTPASGLAQLAKGRGL